MWERGRLAGQPHLSLSYFTGEAAGVRGVAGRGPRSRTCWIPLACLSRMAVLQRTYAHTTHKSVSKGSACAFPSFKPMFSSIPTRLVTILVSSSFFSWGGRLHLVLELDSRWNFNLWLIPWAVSAYGNGHNSLPAQSYHFTGDSPFPFQIILEAQVPMRVSRGPGFPWYRAFETTGR